MSEYALVGQIGGLSKVKQKRFVVWRQCHIRPWCVSCVFSGAVAPRAMASRVNEKQAAVGNINMRPRAHVWSRVRACMIARATTARAAESLYHMLTYVPYMER